MAILIDYHADKDLYFSPQTKHSITMITTEYIYKNDMLVHLQLGSNFALRVNSILQNEFKQDTVLSKDQFFSKKAYSKSKNNKISRSTFNEKLKRFDMNIAVTEREIIEDYTYTDKNDRLDKVQIAVQEKNGKMTAIIEFKNIEHYENFICPAWLSIQTSDI